MRSVQVERRIGSRCEASVLKGRLRNVMLGMPILHTAIVQPLETLTIPDPELVELVYKGTECSAAACESPCCSVPTRGRPPGFPAAAGAMNQAISTEFDAACAFLDVRPPRLR
jgi:hypothetical protein